MSTFWAFLTSLIEWQNVLFTTTVGLGMLLFGIQAFGLFGDHDSDADLDHDMDGAIDHDVHHDLDHDVDHDVSHDGGADSDHDVGHGAAGDSIVFGVMKGLGIGRIPLSLLLPLALGSFGFTGLFASLAFGGIGAGSKTFAELSILPVLGLASAGSVFFLNMTSRLFGKIIPDNAKTASDRYDLLGLVGTVTSGKVDLEFGQVKVKDGFGNALEVPCIALDSGRIPKYGEEVVLVDWEPSMNRFKIVPFSEVSDDEAERLERGRRRARELRTGARARELPVKTDGARA